MKASFSPSWKVKLLLIFTGIAFAFCILEIGLRVAEAVSKRRLRSQAASNGVTTDEMWAAYDPELHWVLNPRFGDHNVDGLRDHPIAPKGTRFRVLVLGDSVGYYGDTVDDTFVGHLRTALRSAPGSDRWEIINACIKGYSNYQESLFLKKYGYKFQPDLVGVEFCLNDVPNFLMTFRVENGKLRPNTYGFEEKALQQARSWPRRLASQSYLLRWAKNNVPVAGNFLRWQADRGFSFQYNSVFRLAWHDEEWNPIAERFQQMLGFGRQKGFSLFVVMVPLKEQYRPDYLARDRDLVLKPQKKMKELCEKLGIPFLDLYPHLSAELFDKTEIHLTKEGRLRVGRAIAAFLLKEKLLP